MHSKNKFN